MKYFVINLLVLLICGAFGAKHNIEQKASFDAWKVCVIKLQWSIIPIVYVFWSCSHSIRFMFASWIIYILVHDLFQRGSKKKYDGSETENSAFDKFANNKAAIDEHNKKFAAKKASFKQGKSKSYTKNKRM